MWAHQHSLGQPPGCRLPAVGQLHTDIVVAEALEGVAENLHSAQSESLQLQLWSENTNNMNIYFSFSKSQPCDLLHVPSHKAQHYQSLRGNYNSVLPPLDDPGCMAKHDKQSFSCVVVQHTHPSGLFFVNFQKKKTRIRLEKEMMAKGRLVVKNKNENMNPLTDYRSTMCPICTTP